MEEDRHMHKLMPKTTEACIRSYVEGQARGEPIVWCVGGVVWPKSDKVIDRMLADKKPKKKKKRVPALPLSRSESLSLLLVTVLTNIISGIDSEGKLQEWAEKKYKQDLQGRKRLKRLFGKHFQQRSDQMRTRKLKKALYRMAKAVNYTVPEGMEWRFLPHVEKIW
eukprot:767256-Hanusia_phi.AAC.2